MDVLREAFEIYREVLPVLLVSLLGGLIAGTVLSGGGMREAIREVPGLLFMLPAFLATRGNIYGSLGARISSGLHQGIIRPRFELDERLTNAVVASLVNGFAISVFIAFASWTILRVLGLESAPLVSLTGIMLVSGFLSAVVMICVLLALLFVGYERGVNPDNITGPIVTTTGDVFGVVFLYTGVVVVEVLL